MKPNLTLPIVVGSAVVLGALGIGLLATAKPAPSTSALVEPRVDDDELTLDVSAPQLATLTTAEVRPAAAAPLRLSGRVVWNEDVTVRVFSPFAGRVVDVLGDVGQHVDAQAVLATIASPDFGQAQADAHRATTDLTLAERTLARMRDLLAHGVVARKDVDAAEADAARARAEAQRAAERVALYGGDSTGVTQLFPLRTPVAGTIVSRALNPGQEVRPDQMLANAPQLFAPLFVVTDPARLWLELDLTEPDLHGLAVGAPLDVRSAAWPDRVFRGRVTLIGSEVDPATRTVKARGVIDNPAGLLKAEMLVSVSAPSSAPGRLAVPASAVLLVGDTHVVFVEERRGRYRRCRVQVGDAQGDVVPVIAGLHAGDRVVTANTLLLEQLFDNATHS